LPTATADESAALIRALARRYGLDLPSNWPSPASAPVPIMLTPGAAEALIVKAYRLLRTQGVDASKALELCLDGYQNPIPHDVLDFQMRIAVLEATDLAFVHPVFRHLAQTAGVARLSP